MSEENKKSQNENQPRRFNQQQYDLLRKCSQKKDLTEWNKYRIDNPNENIELEGVDFRGWYLEGAFLHSGLVKGDKEEIVNLEGRAYLQESIFYNAYLKRAGLSFAHLEGVDLSCVNLEGANLWYAHLQGAQLVLSHLEGASFEAALVNSRTDMFRCYVNKKTDFRNVAIDIIRMNSETKQLLKYNMRRMNWDDWYKEHKILKWPVWLFWRMNDYGNSTWRIIWCFFGVAAVFAAIYYFVPGLTANLHVEGGRFLNIIRACYFSIITMITGFEDINPNDKSIAGHILIAVQVILGYVLLGALIARLAVLFTGEGPAGKFSDKNK